jgi:hypothetical protein
LKIALFAPNFRGHRAHWLEQILASASERDMQVIVYTVEGKLNAEHLNSFGMMSENVVFESCPRTLITRWRLDVENDNAVGVSWEADQILHKFLIVAGRYRLIVMRPYLEGKNPFSIARYLLKNILISALSLRKSIEIARLSIPYAHKKSESHRWVRDDFNTELFFDPVENAEIPEELSSIAKSHEMITVLGYLDFRKNPIRAYQIFEQLRLRGNMKMYLVFAGAQSESFKLKLLKIQNMQNVIQIDRVLTGSEYKGVIKASKVILLAYENRGPSGIVLNSLAIGTPVLLQGGRKWRNLQKIMGGAFRVEKKYAGKLADQLGDLRLRPQLSKVSLLAQEPIPSVRNFILGSIK